MPDERTYGFSFDDAQSLIQSISHGESVFPEIRPRGGGGGGGAASCCCQCVYEKPDLYHETGDFATLLRWTTTLSNPTAWVQTSDGLGECRLAAGSYGVLWNESNDRWEGDCSDGVEFRDLTGVVVTPDSVTGDTIMGWEGNDIDDDLYVEYQIDAVGPAIIEEPPEEEPL